jgi:hypothetical protein
VTCGRAVDRIGSPIFSCGLRGRPTPSTVPWENNCQAETHIFQLLTYFHCVLLYKPYSKHPLSNRLTNSRLVTSNLRKRAIVVVFPMCYGFPMKFGIICLLLSASAFGQGTVDVRSYTRADGTVVSAHTRSCSRCGKSASSPAFGGSARGLVPYSSDHSLPPSLVCGPECRAYWHLDKPKKKRSAEARRAFLQTHVCPSTGRAASKCPGYVIDHIIPLACGGADDPSNMQFQTVAEGKVKDRWERKVYCGN